MGILYVALPVLIYIIGIVFLSHLFEDILPGLCFSFIGNTNRVGSDVGYQTDRSMSLDFNTFIKLLRHHHGLSRGKIHLVGSVLLHAAGRKRSRCLTHTVFLIQRTYDIWILLQLCQNSIVLFLIIYRKLFPLMLCQLSCKDLVLLEVRVDDPVFFRLEVLDLIFAITDDLQCRRLYTPCTQTSSDFSPQKRTDLVAYQTVQHPARLLRIHQIDIDRSRMLDCFLDRLGCDLVKHDPARGILIDPQ